MHLGNALCSKKLFKRELIDRYKDAKDVYFVDMGDCLDLIVAQTGDRRFKASMMDPRYVGVDNPIDLMIDDYIELVRPISDRLLCIVDSNHHLSITERTGTDPTKRICYNLWPGQAEERMLGYSGFLVLKFNYEGQPVKSARTRTFVFSLCHGFGTGGKTEGGFLTTLGHDMSFYDCDVAVYAHNHRLAGHDRVMIGVDGQYKKIISKKRVLLNTGTFLKSFTDDTSTSYAEKARFKPNELGYMELSIRFHRNGEEIYWTKRAFL